MNYGNRIKKSSHAIFHPCPGLNVNNYVYEIPTANKK